MNGSNNGILEALRQNPKSAIAGIILCALLYFTNSPAAINSIPSDYRPLVENLLGALKYGILSVGAWYTFKGPSEREIHKKLEKIQEKPEQTVLPPKELVAAAPVLQSIAAAPVSTEVVISTSAPSTDITRTKPIKKKVAKKIVTKKKTK